MPLSIDIEKPGTYFEASFTSAAGGFAPLPRRVAMVGMQTGSAVAANSISDQVLSPEHADELFGAGSEIALMCRAAFAVGRVRGTMPRLYGIPIAAPNGGSDVARVATIAIGGTPTEADTMAIRIAGRTLRVGVGPSSTPSTIAADLKALIDANGPLLPIAAAVSTGTVTATARHKGVNGNEIRIEKPYVPAGLTVTITQTVAGVGASDPMSALDASLAIDFDAIALPNNASADVTIAGDHLDEAWASGTKKWREIWFGENGTLSDAQTLAAANDYRMRVVAQRNHRSLPSEIAAAFATLSHTLEAPNANFDGFEVPLFGGDAADTWTDAEIEALLDAGVSPIQPSEVRSDRCVVTKLVTTQVSINGTESYVTRDIAVPKTFAFVARQIDARYQVERPETIDAIRDLILDVDRLAEAASYIKNVEIHKPNVTVELDEIVPGRALAVNPVEVVSPLHQAVFSIEVRV